MNSFPENFLWGASISSYQTEGNNFNSDWYEWEEKEKTKDKCGIACDYWNRYQQDHDLAKELGLNAFRISFEWSRIEPREEEFSDEAVEHYRNILNDIKSKGMKTVVTLHHYTVPLWFLHKYGWHKKESVELFSRYCRKVLEKLKDEIDILVTFNEPRFPAGRGYLAGNRPPGKINPFNYFLAKKNIIESHKACYRIVKKIKNSIPVGITENYTGFDFFGGSNPIQFITSRVERFFAWGISDEIKEFQDFTGINYYYEIKVSWKFPFISMSKSREETTDMGWGIFPEGLLKIIEKCQIRFQKPIYIFENGIAIQNDEIRADFIKSHIDSVKKAIEKGIDVRGYFYWSLMDNFEWESGFGKRFGLVEIDYKTLERKPRKSFYVYRDLISAKGGSASG